MDTRAYIDVPGSPAEALARARAGLADWWRFVRSVLCSDDAEAIGWLLSVSSVIAAALQ